MGYSEGETALILTHAFNAVSEKLLVLAVAFDHSPYTAPADSRPPIPWYHPEGGISLLFPSRTAADAALNFFSPPTGTTRAARQLRRGQEDPLHKVIRIDLGVTTRPGHASQELQKREWSFPPLDVGETERRAALSIAGQLGVRKSQPTASTSAPILPTPTGSVTTEERPRTVFIGNLPVNNVRSLFQYATGASSAPRADLIMETWLQALTTRLGLDVERIVLPLNAAGTWDIARGASIVFSNSEGEGVANARDMVRRINLPKDEPDSLQHLIMAAIPRSGGEPVYVRPSHAITANMGDGSTSQWSEWQLVRRPARRSTGRGNPTSAPQSAFSSTSNPTYAMVVSPTKTTNAARNARHPTAPKPAPAAAASTSVRRSLHTQMENQTASIAISPQQTQLSSATRSQNARIDKLESSMEGMKASNEEMKAMLQQMQAMLLQSQLFNSPARKQRKSDHNNDQKDDKGEEDKDKMDEGHD